MPTSRILFLGDVCSEPGRIAVRTALPKLKQDTRADFTIVNAENVAGGYGITPKFGEELLALGADCLTLGDHAFDRKEGLDYLNAQLKVLRPANYPATAPGRGYRVFDSAAGKFAVVNLLGRVYLKPCDCPFQRARLIVNEVSALTKVIIVDMHAEATAEKQAMGWFLDGHVSAVLGTHTHVQTADERVLPQGTAYITDVGMCGSFDSVLGMDKEGAVKRLLDCMPVKLHPGKADYRVNAVVVEVDVLTGRAQGIERLSVPVAPPA